MTYPVPSSVQALTQKADYWRLHTEIESSGDIFESDSDAHAFSIGDDSDVARVKISYFDPLERDKVNDQIVSVDKPFIGRISANFTETFSTGQTGRILISLVDLMPPEGFLPPSWVAGQRVSTVRPVIDLVQYLHSQPSYLPNRSDKLYRWATTGSLNLTQGYWNIVPFYGRRFGQVTVKNLAFTAQPNIAVTTFGINFSILSSVAGLYQDNGNEEIQIDTDAAVIPGATVTQIISNQLFDAIAVRIVPASGIASPESISTVITVSDKI
jgi:hypothetical protein